MKAKMGMTETMFTPFIYQIRYECHFICIQLLVKYIFAPRTFNLNQTNYNTNTYFIAMNSQEVAISMLFGSISSLIGAITATGGGGGTSGVTG